MGCHRYRYVIAFLCPPLFIFSRFCSREGASKKVDKYAQISISHDFVPIAIETLDLINITGAAFINALGKKIFGVTGDNREIRFLFQRISVCLQRYNSLAIRSTFADCDPVTVVQSSGVAADRTWGKLGFDKRTDYFKYFCFLCVICQICQLSSFSIINSVLLI